MDAQTAIAITDLSDQNAALKREMKAAIWLLRDALDAYRADDGHVTEEILNRVIERMTLCPARQTTITFGD